MSLQQQVAAATAPVQEDFYLLDLIGGASQTCLHPTRPIVAYSSGCMIVVYDMMTDQKINLVHHQHELFALAFSPPGAGASQTGGDFLIFIIFYIKSSRYQSTMIEMMLMIPIHHQIVQCVCGIGKKGNVCRKSRFQNLRTKMRKLIFIEAIYPSYYQIKFIQNGSYIYQAGSNYPQPKNIQISFEKVGSLFFVLESSSTDAGSGYRATLWNLNRQQRVEMVNQLELELQNSCLGLQILPKQSYSAGSLHQQSINANGSQQTVNKTTEHFTALKKVLK